MLTMTIGHVSTGKDDDDDDNFIGHISKNKDNDNGHVSNDDDN